MEPLRADQITIVATDVRSDSMNGALFELVESLADRGIIREDEVSSIVDEVQTHSGEYAFAEGGIAIPHARVAIGRPGVLVFGRSILGIRCKGAGLPVRAIFLLLFHPDFVSEYLHMLALLSRLLQRPGFVDKLVEQPCLEVTVKRMLASARPNARMNSTVD